MRLWPSVRDFWARVAAGAVVIPGYRPKKFAAGNFGVPCALVIGTRRESTDRKTSLNDALREYGVPVVQAAAIERRSHGIPDRDQ